MSKIRILSWTLISTQDVFPPYIENALPGVGILPLTPQKNFHFNSLL